MRVSVASLTVNVMALMILVSVNVYLDTVIQGQRTTIQLLMQKPLCPAIETRPVVPTPKPTPKTRQRNEHKPTGYDPAAHYVFNGGDSGRT